MLIFFLIQSQCSIQRILVTECVNTFIIIPKIKSKFLLSFWITSFLKQEDIPEYGTKSVGQVVSNCKYISKCGKSKIPLINNVFRHLTIRKFYWQKAVELGHSSASEIIQLMQDSLNSTSYKFKVILIFNFGHFLTEHQVYLYFS